MKAERRREHPVLTVRQRMEFLVARAAAALPPRAQIRFSGRPPICIDGQTLEPEVQLILRLSEKVGPPPLEDLPVPEARATMPDAGAHGRWAPCAGGLRS